MEPLLQVLGTILGSALMSSGLWAYFARKDKSRSAQARLLLGLAYDKILDRGEQYIVRGWITMDEFNEYQRYLYGPYKDLGGNGMADKVMQELQRLPLKAYRPYAETVRSQSQTKEMPNVNPHPRQGGRHSRPDYGSFAE